MDRWILLWSSSMVSVVSVLLRRRSLLRLIEFYRYNILSQQNTSCVG